MPVAAVTPTTPLTASTPIIPSPSSVSIPSVVQHEPSSVTNSQLHVHQSIPNNHHRTNEQSQTAATIAAHHHIDQTMLTHHQLTSSTATKSLIIQPNSQEYAAMDQYETPIYTNHYNATGIMHPTMDSHQSHHQHGSEFVDLNYYNNYYTTYDDQMRPYSASSNSCSSSNSDGDSQLTSHGMHQNYNNNNNLHSHHHSHHNSQHQIGQTGGILSSNTTSATATTTTTPGELNDIRSNGVDSNISPNEYGDCMNRQPQHIFELNCFGGIGHMDNATNTHQLHDDVHGNYMHEYSKNHIGDIHHMSTHVATNGSGIAELSANNGTNVDAIQYTSVIVEPTNYHMTNEYVH